MSIINDVLVDKLFKDPPKRTKEIPLLSEKTASGDEMVLINDAYSDFPIKNLTLQGNTQQDSTTGKNVVFVPDIEAGSELQNIPCLLENGVYISCHENTAKVSKNVWRIRIEYKDGSLKYLTDSQMETGSEFTCSTENPIIAIRPRGINIESGAYRKIQVEYGSAKTNYEPYTGGKPSPSPDYPQEIKNVGKWNEETQKYEVDVMVTNAEQDWDKEQSLTITSDRPITKWDKLVEQDGQIGWLYKAVFDSDVRPSRMDLFPSGFSIYKNHSNGVFTYKASFAKKEIGWQTSICKQFKNVNGSYGSGTLWNYSDQPAIDMVYFNSNIATLESFVKWMEENPLEMVYKSRESEFIPLQQSEQDAIRALTTYYPTTVVTVDGGELPVGIEVTYMHPEYIPTKQSALRMWFKENPII